MNGACSSVVSGGVASLSHQRERVDHPSDKPVHITLGRGQWVLNKPDREHGTRGLSRVFEACVTVVAQATDFVIVTSWRGRVSVVNKVVIHARRSAVNFKVDVRHQFNSVLAQNATAPKHLDRAVNGGTCAPQSSSKGGLRAGYAFTVDVLDDHPLDRRQADGQLLSHALFATTWMCSKLAVRSP